MQSSLGGVLRALVMLVCLILAPLVALPDVSIPVWLKQLTKGRWSGQWCGQAKSASDSQAAQAKPVQPPQRNGRASSCLFGALPAAFGQAESGWPSLQTSPDNPTLPTGQAMPANPAAIAANLKASLAPQDGKPPVSDDPARLLKMAAAGDAAAVAGRTLSRLAGEGLSRAQGVIPTAFVEQSRPSRDPLSVGTNQIRDRSLARQGAPATPATQETSAQPNPQPSAEQLSRFRVVEERLRRLGAAHYLLEAWGNATEYYRFRCRMPVAGSSTAVRHFEATDSDGLAAMSKVLAEIEAWQAQSL